MSRQCRAQPAGSAAGRWDVRAGACQRRCPPQAGRWKCTSRSRRGVAWPSTPCRARVGCGSHAANAHQGKTQVSLLLQHRVGEVHEAPPKARHGDPGAAHGVDDEEDGQAGGQRPEQAWGRGGEHGGRGAGAQAGRQGGRGSCMCGVLPAGTGPHVTPEASRSTFSMARDPYAMPQTPVARMRCVLPVPMPARQRHAAHGGAQPQARVPVRRAHPQRPRS